MSQTRSTRRVRWLILGLATAGLVAAGSLAVGIAMTTPPEEIVLTLDGGTNEFRYGDETQPVTLGRNACTVADSALDGDIIVISATTFDKKGKEVDPAPIGYVEEGIGVNEKGNGNGQDCGRVDYLSDGDTEALILELGPAVTGQMISSIDFDFEAKFDAQVRIEFLRDGNAFDEVIPDPFSSGSDSGPDSKFRDKYAYTAATSLGLFDGVRISMVSGGVSLEGGATWEYSEEDPDDHRTVFHLASAVAEVSIDATTNGSDGPYIAVDAPVLWTYDVQNTGDQALSGIVVTDPSVGSISCPATVLAADESMTCTASGGAVAGQFNNTGTVTATAEFGASVDASDTSSYFGSAPGIGLSVETNGPGELPSDGPYINATDAVTWTYTVTNAGNVPLSTITVDDDQSGVTPGFVSGDTNGDSRLDIGETWLYTASGVAEVSAVGSPYANEGTASGRDPIGVEARKSDTSSYFGSNPSITVDVDNNGPVVVTGTNVVWDFTVNNTGNVPLTLVAVTEDGTERCDLGTVAPGGTATCQYSAPALGGPQTTTFIAKGTDPLGVVTSESSGTVEYFGGLDCGDSTTEGGPYLADSPLAGFYVGPNSKDLDCAVPVEITSDSNPDGEQIVNVGPPFGFDWIGVTGVVTIEWDEEAPDNSEGISRTLQRLGTGDIVIPWCNDVIDITMSTSEFFYELTDPNAMYPTATAPPDGDVCLIFQNTSTVDDGGTIFTQTIETFYIWNDPRFVRN